jgi:hypothetical protein
MLDHTYWNLEVLQVLGEPQSYEVYVKVGDYEVHEDKQQLR